MESLKWEAHGGLYNSFDTDKERNSDLENRIDIVFPMQYRKPKR